MRQATAKTPFWERIPHRAAVPLILVTAVILAVSSLHRDSITFDETNHFAAGLVRLKTGDFRLAPETPPLAQMLVAAPALLVEHKWPERDAPGWARGDIWPFACHLLNVVNDGDRWITPARYMMVFLLTVTFLAVYAGTRMLFGRTASLLALLCACLSPTFLAHGRLVTTDLPVTLAFMVVLISYAQLFARVTWLRLIAALSAISALCLVKFSWPLIGPALFVMAGWVIVRREPMVLALRRRRASDDGAEDRMSTGIDRRGKRLAVVSLIGLLSVGAMYGSIWCCYGFRYAPSNADEVGLTAQGSRGRAAATGRDAAWEMTLQDSEGAPLEGAVAGFVRWAHDRHALPEAYLFGLAFTRKTVEGQISYLLGETFDGGRISYFPIAFAIKTPLGILLLLAAGIAAWCLRGRLRCGAPVLMWGLTAFVATYLIVVLPSDVNLGHRHLLPCYAPIMILCGASVSWLNHRFMRWGVIAGVLLVAFANASIYPQYLCYFNEVIGGPAHGHRYLLDSNIDWGQDLKRLAVYTRQHSDERIKLSYFGSANPSTYGIDCEMMPSQLNFGGKLATLTAGTYVVSANQLRGLYTRQIRDSVWRLVINQQRYRSMAARFSKPPPSEMNDAQRAEYERDKRKFEEAQRWLLLNRLSRRAADDRIGWSLFVYRLSQSDVDSLVTLPPRNGAGISAPD